MTYWNVGTVLLLIAVLFGVYKYAEYFLNRRKARKAQSGSGLSGGGKESPKKSLK